MRSISKKLAVTTLFVVSTVSFAAPMPNTIMVEDKAVVPVLKTEVLRRVEGQQPVRHVEATILEITNKGKDIVAKEVVFDDTLVQFSDKKMSIPVIQKGGRDCSHL
jgi:protein-disulfide isomerase